MIGTLFLPETPKFLITQKRYDDARAAINFFNPNRETYPFKGKFDKEVLEMKNSGPVNDDMTSAISFVSVENHTPAQENQRIDGPHVSLNEESKLTGSLKDLIKIKRHFKNLIIMIYIWVASSFDVYLLGFLLKYLPGDIFHNTLTTNACDVPISLIAGITYQKLGIRIALFIAFVFSTIGSLVMIFFAEKYPDIVPIMVLLAKGGVKMSFTIIFFANSQIFPCIFAGTALGLCNMGAKFATILAPYMAEVDPPVPMIMCSIIASIAAISSLFIEVEPKKEKKAHDSILLDEDIVE